MKELLKPVLIGVAINLILPQIIKPFASPVELKRSKHETATGTPYGSSHTNSSFKLHSCRYNSWIIYINQ